MSGGRLQVAEEAVDTALVGHEYRCCLERCDARCRHVVEPY